MQPTELNTDPSPFAASTTTASDAMAAVLSTPNPRLIQNCGAAEERAVESVTAKASILRWTQPGRLSRRLGRNSVGEGARKGRGESRLGI
ncbi:hypothetical protein GUJ93_ZPchr0002g24376 [Zizania palustris]|uniref:Uncharacterized protein n=1 Tax=Zizania palustris TaxID=103762 RepID=A0A8J5VBQ6_ZIZPA|nr:hypothetical protein GUJ93_ZPchr0002g24376 [Zizania palustris]